MGGRDESAPGSGGRSPEGRAEVAPDEWIGVGRIGRPYGVRGWVHVHSDMEPPEALLAHRSWCLSERGGRSAGAGPAGTWFEVEQARVHGHGLVALFHGVGERDAAARLTGRVVRLARATLPSLDEDEFYWVDLIGCDVVTPEGGTLGRIERFLETGANDVMVVEGERERLIPFTLGDTVKRVMLDERRVVVDWDPEF